MPETTPSSTNLSSRIEAEFPRLMSRIVSARQGIGIKERGPTTWEIYNAKGDKIGTASIGPDGTKRYLGQVPGAPPIQIPRGAGGTYTINPSDENARLEYNPRTKQRTDLIGMFGSANIDFP